MNDPLKRSALFSRLTNLADRLQSDPTYMAWVLQAYSRTEGLSPERLLDRLGIDPDMLTRLAICKRPVADSPQFAAQVVQIANYTAIDAGLLANVIRQVDALALLVKMRTAQEAPTGNPASSLSLSGLMAAARDRAEENKEEPTAPEGENTTEEDQ